MSSLVSEKRLVADVGCHPVGPSWNETLLEMWPELEPGKRVFLGTAVSFGCKGAHRLNVRFPIPFPFHKRSRWTGPLSHLLPRVGSLVPPASHLRPYIQL